MQKRRYVNDNVHGLIRCTYLETLVMQQTLFSRLHGVYQNSVAYLTWPSNRVQRFEHSLGTMKLAGDMFFSAVMNADEPDRTAFLEDFSEEVASILQSISSEERSLYFFESENVINGAIASWKKNHQIKSNDSIRATLGDSAKYVLPDFSWRLIPGEVSEDYQATCYLLMQSVRMAGMLHDIGHPPFSHAVEHALEALETEVDASSGERAAKFCEGMARLRSIADKTHEGMGQLLTDELFKYVLLKYARGYNKMAPLALEYYIIYKMTAAILQDKGKFSDIHKIISSSVDADRLDFVRRDSLSSGLGVETVQYPRIVNDIKLVKRGEADDVHPKYVFAFPKKSIGSLEAFLRQRYQNYNTIVWHHRVVKSEALLDKVISKLGLRVLRSPDEQAPTVRHLPSNISGLWTPFLGLDNNGVLANRQILGQWNDAWLMTTLAGEYVDLCLKREDSSASEEDILLLEMLAELLYGEKHYISLVKRYGDIASVADVFTSALENNPDFDIDEARKTLEGYLSSKLSESVDDEHNEMDAGASAKAFLSFLPAKEVKKDNGITRNALILAKTNYDALVSSDSQEGSYRDLIHSMINNFISEEKQVAGNEALDHLVVFRTLSAGMMDATYLYAPDGGLSELEDESNVKVAIGLEELARPPFYVYMRFESAGGWTTDKENELRGRFVGSIAKQLADWYIQMYTDFVGIVKR